MHILGGSLTEYATPRLVCSFPGLLAANARLGMISQEGRYVEGLVNFSLSANPIFSLDIVAARTQNHQSHSRHYCLSRDYYTTYSATLMLRRTCSTMLTKPLPLLRRAQCDYHLIRKHGRESTVIIS